MREILEQVKQWKAEGKPIAIATNVRMHGSGLRPLGAKLAVTENGEFAGSVSGGCIEGAVVEAALEVIANGTPQLLHFGVSDDKNPWDIGLTCGTSLEVLVEPFESSSWQEVFADLTSVLSNNSPCGLVSVLSNDSLGKKMLVTEKKALAGGGISASADAQIAAWAGEQIRINRPANRTFEGVDVFVDVLPPSPRLVIIGAVHVAIPLVELAHKMGFHTIVVDPRTSYVQPDRFPLADKMIKKWPQEALPDLHLDQGTYFAALSHDDKLDNPALAIALQSEARYVGVIGARTNIPKRKETLREMGVSEEQLERLHAPIGLPIGAIEPEEIAISILSEMIAAKYGKAK